MTCRRLPLFAFLAALLAVPAFAPQAAAAPFDANQKEALNEMMRSYILENPDVLIESVTTYQIEQQAKAQAEQDAAVKDMAGDIKSNDDLPVAGNPDGDVTIVEFFDYNCGYCKKAWEEVSTVLDEDKNVKVLFIDMPILGPSSYEAAKWALAAQEQGKYFAFHRALMEYQGGKDEEALTRIAKEVGLDVAKLREDAESDKVAAQIAENMELSEKLSINGTPAFLIGEEMNRGYIDYDTMKEQIAAARKND